MISAIVLAAGTSSRMGQCKQLLRLGGVSILEHVLKGIKKSKIDETILVLGSSAEEIIEKMAWLSQDTPKIVYNPDFETGMSSSLRVGLEATSDIVDAAMVFLADMPLSANPTIIDLIINEYYLSWAPIILPECRGKWGHPVLFDKCMFPAIKKITGDVGAKSIIKAYVNLVKKVKVKTPAVLLDIDYLEDLERVRAYLKKPMMEAY